MSDRDTLNLAAEAAAVLAGDADDPFLRTLAMIWSALDYRDEHDPAFTRDAMWDYHVALANTWIEVTA